MGGMSTVPIVPMDIREITTRISKGEKLFRLLRELEIPPIRFFKYLDDHPEDKIIFERARQISVEQMIDEADGHLMSAENKFELEKAKAMTAHRSWMAERLIPSTYGTKVEHNVTHIDIKTILLEAEGRMIKIPNQVINAKSVSLPSAEEKKNDEKELTIEDLMG